MVCSRRLPGVRPRCYAAGAGAAGMADHGRTTPGPPTATVKAMTRKGSTVLAALLLTAAVAGCDLGGSPSSAQPSPSSSLGKQQIRAIAQEWVQCLRERGLTRMPDPNVADDGRVTYPGTGYDFKADFQRHPDIVQACKSIIDRIPESLRRRGSDLSADDIRKLTEFAKCVRSKGAPEFPDPNASGDFNLAGTPLANERPQVRMDRAFDACKGIWSGEIRLMDGVTKGGGKK